MTSAGPITVSVHSVRPVVAHAQAIGLDVERLLADAGIERSTLDDGDARVPHPSAVALWKHAVLTSGDEAYGLHAAETTQPVSFDVLGYAMLSSATLGDALSRMCRYHRLFHDAAVVQLSVEGSLARLSHTLPLSVPPLPRAVGDFIAARWVTVARQITGLDFATREVGLRHRAPIDASEYARVFRGVVRFEQPVTSVAIASELLDAPLIKADPGLCRVLERHAQEVLDRLPRGTSFGARVQELIAGELNGRTPVVEDIAKRLHMSARTLHRRLADEGTSFQAIVEELRRELAIRHLEQRQVAVSEVAFLLGFSEASAFHRAFKRWTGTTPAEYRRSVA